MTDGRAPAVAIAVVSWNTRELLRDALRSMESDARDGRAEVWVVDNGSVDGSPELVEREFPWARLVRSTRNIGFGAAVNLVAERTHTLWIAASNADIALGPGALATLLEAGARDRGAGALAPRLLLPGGATQHSVHSLPTLASAALMSLGLRHVMRGLSERLCLPGAWDPERPRRVDWAMGAFLLVRRAAWEQADGFDPCQWMYAEDVDLGWRLRRAGWWTRYEPAARVRHAAGAATGRAEWAHAIDERKGWSTYAWMLRRRGPAITRGMAAINLIGVAVRWVVATPRSPLSTSARPGAQRARLRAWWRFHRCGLRPRAALEDHR